MSETVRVFVYGTLRRGCGNHGLLKDAKYLGDAEISGRSWVMLHLGGFPGVIHGRQDPTRSPVKGEVYEVNMSTLAALDRLEGAPDFYYRQQNVVTMTSSESQNDVTVGQEIWTFMYLLPRSYEEFNPTIVTGDWLNVGLASSTKPQGDVYADA